VTDQHRAAGEQAYAVGSLPGRSWRRITNRPRRRRRLHRRPETPPWWPEPARSAASARIVARAC